MRSSHNQPKTIPLQQSDLDNKTVEGLNTISPRTSDMQLTKVYEKRTIKSAVTKGRQSAISQSRGRTKEIL